jgi:uncharacterized protein YkwD
VIFPSGAGILAGWYFAVLAGWGAAGARARAPSQNEPTEGDALKRLRILLSLALLCALAATAAPPPAMAARSIPGNGMMDAINYLRAKSGLRTLKKSGRLVRSSAARAEFLMRRDLFAHPARLTVPTFDRVGEVLEIHGGHRPRMGNALRRLWNSYGHRAVMMSSHYRQIGAARAVGRYRGARATIWVIRFGKR